jgi:glycosyltransferase involved in cell wall biosynthesis
VPVSGDQLVSVVIPAYNAAATLDETLCSVRAQTHSALEIIVVDDGSTDATRALAERHAAADPRVHVLHQANAGVAAARNAGWKHSRSEFIAFVDADDLWAPTKIERQVQALMAAGPQAGLAYCWTARLDASGVVTRCYGGTRHEGEALSKILRSNFIGSGSNVLVRRQAVVDAEGFDSRLRAAGAEGCEDWLFNCRVAETHHFVSVPDYLVGYRYLHDSMSSNRQRMLRSHMLMCRQMIARRPEQSAATLGGLQGYCAWLLREAIDMRGPRQAWLLWLLMWREHRTVAWRVLWRDLLLDPARFVRDRFQRLRGHTVATPVIARGRRFLDTLQP